jgi:Domain of unknown function (DUF1883)
MDFTHEDVGQLAGGSTVIVGFEGPDANVMLLTPTQFTRYRSGGLLGRCVGGHYRCSPVQLEVPYDGRWQVVVDCDEPDEHLEAWIVDVISLAA